MKKRISKKTAVYIGFALLAVVLVAAGVRVFLIRGNTDDISDRRRESGLSGENVITAGGITATGITEEKYELDFLETKLYVEESYLSTGDTVEAGTKVFKVGRESLEEAREELKRAATEAELACRQGMIACETGKLEAEKERSLSEIYKEFAQAEYDSEVTEAKQKVRELEKQTEEAEALYNEYTAAVENNFYYTEYQVEELKDAYYDHFSFLMELYEKWDVEGLYDRYPNRSAVVNRSDSGNAKDAGADSEMGTPDTAEAADGGTQESGTGGAQMKQQASLSGNDEADKLTVYEMMEELVTADGEKYEEALENYEKDTRMAAAALDQAKSSLATLKAQLSEAQLSCEKQMIAARAAYDTALAEGENAGNVYDTAIRKLEEEYEALKEEKEDTQEHLALFEETFGDGYYYTTGAGSIVRNMARPGKYLSEETDMLLAYSDPASVTVAASVDQEDIAGIQVGDTAYVSVSGYGGYEGHVTDIDPVSGSDSRSSVTYTVNVELSGDVGALASNLTATVYLGITDEQLERLKQMDGAGKETEKKRQEEQSVQTLQHKEGGKTQ